MHPECSQRHPQPDLAEILQLLLVFLPPLSLLPKPVFTYILSSPILRGSSGNDRILGSSQLLMPRAPPSISWRPLWEPFISLHYSDLYTHLSPSQTRVSAAFLGAAGVGERQGRESLFS